MTASIDWIAVDWGSTHLRTYAMQQDGQLVHEKTSAQGMGSLASEEFESALLALIADWLPAVQEDTAAIEPMDVIACGMVGARQGWKEAPYRSTPCRPSSDKGAISVTTLDQRIAVKILPGICQSEPADIMRGEETQIGGLIAQEGLNQGTICLPGTHSKWVSLADSKIQHFATYMTGEVFSLLSEHSMLRHTVTSENWDDDAFLSGVKTSIEKPEDLLSNCFRLRAKHMLQGLAAARARSTLSGLIIGAELSGANAYWQQQTVALIGEPALSQLYAAALESLGVSTRIHDPKQLTLQGLTKVYQR